jgi:DNA-directed RNA polymerase subunit E'/Rpb7
MIQETNLFVESVLSRRLHFLITDLRLNTSDEFQQFVETQAKNEFEGICIDEGYVRPNTLKVVNISSGLLERSKISYDVMFRCEIFRPVADAVISCKAISATKAGIRAMSSSASSVESSPFIAFITREHNVKEKDYLKTEKDETFLASILAFRFELNDKNVSIIGKFLKKKKK